MNKIIAIFAAVLLSCGSNGDVTGISQEQQEKTNISSEQKDILLGEFKPKELEKRPFSKWFLPSYESFNPEDKALKTIEEHISDYKIILVMGTWCGDSRREVPKFFKLLDKVNYDMNKLTAIGVDRNKTTPSNIEKELSVSRVPTIIFYKNGKEVNRFVEYAQESLEEDIAKIVSEEKYSNPYAE